MKKILRNIIKLWPALTFYFLGMAGLLFADIFISATAQKDTIAFWAFVKSILFISSTLAILGLDQAIVRYPGAFLSNFKSTLIQILVISCLLSFVFSKTNQQINFPSIALLIFLTAMLALFFAISRGANSFNIAQINLNGWKFLFLLFLVLLSRLGIQGYVFWSIFSALLVSLIFSILLFLKNTKIVDFYTLKAKELPIPKTQFRLAALQLFLLSISLNFSINLEQLLLNFSGRPQESAILFAHFVIFTPLLLFANGFTGFLLGPYLREKIHEIFNKLPFLFFLYLCVGGIVSILAFFIGKQLFHHLYDGKFTIQYSIVMFCLAIGLLRFFYTIPSSFISIVASTKTLRNFTFLGIIALGLSIFIYFIVVISTHNHLNGIIYASIINWSLRSLGGLTLTIHEYNRMKIDHQY